METNWIKTEERKPIEDGFYIVCWATPYTQDNMTIDVVYFRDNHFDGETNGANYIAFWLENLELPLLSKEDRNKLVK